MEIDKVNMPYRKDTTNEEIINRVFSIGYLLQTNAHNELLNNIREKVLAKYLVRAKFKHLGFNGDKLYCNGQRLIYRPNKFSNIKIGKNVKLLKNNISKSGGGSNSYPAIGGEGTFCVLEFISYGLPCIDRVNGWSINIIDLKKIED